MLGDLKKKSRPGENDEERVVLKLTAETENSRTHETPDKGSGGGKGEGYEVRRLRQTCYNMYFT